jgi:hypothetical protein
VGLIARELERRGIPTVTLSSAWSITAAVAPPRAVFIDFPLGHTAGKPRDRSLQRHIMIEALSALDGIQTPGTIRRLPFRWAASDDWKDAVMRPAPLAQKRDGAGDDRKPRHATPQYQFPADELAAKRATRHGRCPSCVFLEPQKPPRGS